MSPSLSRAFKSSPASWAGRRFQLTDETQETTRLIKETLEPHHEEFDEIHSAVLCSSVQSCCTVEHVAAMRTGTRLELQESQGTSNTQITNVRDDVRRFQDRHE